MRLGGMRGIVGGGGAGGLGVECGTNHTARCTPHHRWQPSRVGIERSGWCSLGDSNGSPAGTVGCIIGRGGQGKREGRRS